MFWSIVKIYLKNQCSTCLNVFLELFGKAKKKILKQEDFVEHSSSSTQQSPTGYIAWEEQELGKSNQNRLCLEG